MAVSIVNSPQTTLDFQNSANLSYTAETGSNRLLLVLGGARASSSGRTISSLVWGATNLNYELVDQGASGRYAFHGWAKETLATGANSFAVTWSGTMADAGKAVAMTLAGVEQSSPIRAVIETIDTTSAATIVSTPSVNVYDGDMAILVGMISVNQSLSVSGYTEHLDVSVEASDGRVGVWTKAITADGTEAPTVTINGTGNGVLQLIIVRAYKTGDFYVYVDPTNGSDTTGGGDTNATAAAEKPYASLKTAEAACRRNLTTQTGRVIFRCLQGSDVIAGGTIDITSTNWPGSTSNYHLIIEGYGNGVHDGKVAAGVGYTLTCASDSSFGQNALLNVVLNYSKVRDIRGRQMRAGSGAFYSLVFGGSSQTVDRVIAYCQDGQGLGFSGSGSTVTNSLGVGNRYGIYMSFGNTVRHCTAISKSGDYSGLRSASTSNVIEYCYARNPSGGAQTAYSEPSIPATKTRIATSDASGTDEPGDGSLRNIAYSTSSGAYFTSITSGAEELSISSSSALKDKATGSGQTIDIVGASRTTPDIGAFEYVGSTAPTISDAGDETFYDGETSITITGTNFGASQGAGSVIISPSDNVADVNAVTQTVTSWADTEIQFTAVQKHLVTNATLYLFVKENGTAANATGHQVKFKYRGPMVPTTFLRPQNATASGTGTVA